ncbi:MAG: hypothetical protein HY093_01530 [Candidatus Liptonbacteria bacterium]|nr:hypothetical protein [Candidatus Liptonbacteria bacterium]
MTNLEQKQNGWLEPASSQPRGAPLRAERRGFPPHKTNGRHEVPPTDSSVKNRKV